jgi:hypothetical protein
MFMLMCCHAHRLFSCQAHLTVSTCGTRIHDPVCDFSIRIRVQYCIFYVNKSINYDAIEIGHERAWTVTLSWHWRESETLLSHTVSHWQGAQQAPEN